MGHASSGDFATPPSWYAGAALAVLLAAIVARVL